jgi:hypothetical protein
MMGRLAQLSTRALAHSPTDAEGLVRRIVMARRQQVHSPLDDVLDNDEGLPPFERHIEEVRKELEVLANEPDKARPSGQEA